MERKIEKTYFALLFDLLQLGGRVAEQAWQLLSRLPTNADLLQAVYELGAGEASADWSLLDAAAAPRLLYTLQLVDFYSDTVGYVGVRATGNVAGDYLLAGPGWKGAVPKGNPGSWATTNDYPSRALREEREGTSGFRVTVGPDGRVTDCQITSSSGHADLDAATCDNVRRRARFNPAMDGDGNPTTGSYSNRVRWVIPKD